MGAGTRAMFVSVVPSRSSRVLSPHAGGSTRSPSCARERVPCYPVIPIVDIRGRETALKGGQTFFELGRGLGFYYGSVRIMKSTSQRLVGWSRFNNAGWGCRNPIKFAFHRSGYWGHSLDYLTRFRSPGVRARLAPNRNHQLRWTVTRFDERSMCG